MPSALTTSRRVKRSRNSSSSRSATRAFSPPHALRPDARTAAADEALVEDVRSGLTAPVPWIPAKYLYDDRGSRLFEEITRQPEYYQTRTEEAILAGAAADVVARTRPGELLELGSGEGRKIRLLIEALR